MRPNAIPVVMNGRQLVALLLISHDICAPQRTHDIIELEDAKGQK